MLALKGDAGDSLARVWGSVNDTDAIRYRDESLARWAPLTAATCGEDGALKHLASGDLAGFKMLTVFIFIPESSIALLLFAGSGLLGLFPLRKLSWRLILALFAVMTLAESAAAQATNLPGWRLVWQDEFNLPSVDTTKWEALSRPNSYNEEKQYYLRQQASIIDGHLRITATNQPIANKQYRSARLESWQAFGPGRFEARIDLPTGQGMWPAFWLFPNDPRIPWPTGGEIDVLENRGSQPELVSSAYHWQAEPGPCCNNARYVFGEYAAFGESGLVNFHEGFHIYAAEWETDEIRFYVDGELSFTVTETPSRPVFETPKNIILNLAVGGLFGGDPDFSTAFPQVMDVDYVRVWEAVPEPPTLLLVCLVFAILGGLPGRRDGARQISFPPYPWGRWPPR